MELEENLIQLFESIEDCLLKRRLLPCLILLYSAIDIVSSLASGRASGVCFYGMGRQVSFARGISPMHRFRPLRCSLRYPAHFECLIQHVTEGAARQVVYAPPSRLFC